MAAFRGPVGHFGKPWVSIYMPRVSALRWLKPRSPIPCDMIIGQVWLLSWEFAYIDAAVYILGKFESMEWIAMIYRGLQNKRVRMLQMLQWCNHACLISSDSLVDQVVTLYTSERVDLALVPIRTSWTSFGAALELNKMYIYKQMDVIFVLAPYFVVDPGNLLI